MTGSVYPVEDVKKIMEGFICRIWSKMEPAISLVLVEPVVLIQNRSHEIL